MNFFSLLSHTVHSEMCNNFLSFYVPYGDVSGKQKMTCSGLPLETEEIMNLPLPSEEVVNISTFFKAELIIHVFQMNVTPPEDEMLSNQISSNSNENGSRKAMFVVVVLVPGVIFLLYICLKGFLSNCRNSCKGYSNVLMKKS